jgi:hypothetical protein
MRLHAWIFAPRYTTIPLNTTMKMPVNKIFTNAQIFMRNVIKAEYDMVLYTYELHHGTPL